MRPLLRLLRFLRPYRKKVAIGTVCLLLSIPCSLFHPLAWRFIVDEVILDKRYDMLLPALGVMLGVHAAGTLLGMLRSWQLGSAGQCFVFDIRNAVYAKLQGQGLEYFHARRSGDIISRTISDVEAVQSAVVGGIDEIFSSLVSFIFVAGIIIALHPVVGTVTLVPLVLVGALIFLFNKRVKALYRRIRDRLGEVQSKLQENISGISVIKSFGREPFEVRRFRGVAQGYLTESLTGVKISAVYMPSVMIVGFLSNIVMIGLGAWFVIKGSFTLGGLVAYRGYWWQLFAPVMSVARINEVWQRANAAASRIVEVLDAETLVADRQDARALAPVEERIEFRQVTFGYETSRPVLTAVDLRIDAGQVAGIVGPSGAGKSTLLSLLLRFYDPSRGAVLLDGIDVREVTQESLRSQFAVVAQDAFLFNETLFNNIRYGKLDATREQVERAARLANAHQFISELPAGYDSLVGERGVKLSGGQRQRICIARAFLADPRILLLDEATAAVEPEAELLIQAALKRLMAGRTTLIVSHRLSMVRDADVIFVVKDGHISEQGTHEELMRRRGWYEEMYLLQMGDAAYHAEREVPHLAGEEQAFGAHCSKQ